VCSTRGGAQIGWLATNHVHQGQELKCQKVRLMWIKGVKCKFKVLAHLLDCLLRTYLNHAKGTILHKDGCLGTIFRLCYVWMLNVKSPQTMHVKHKNYIARWLICCK
jgi:hypothetical protein